MKRKSCYVCACVRPAFPYPEELAVCDATGCREKRVSSDPNTPPPAWCQYAGDDV